MLGGGAVCLDAASRTIQLQDGRSCQADGIVIATGARARQLPTLAGLSNVFYPADPRRCPRPGPRAGAREQDGRHRCRLHRCGSRLCRCVPGHGSHHDQHQAGARSPRSSGRRWAAVVAGLHAANGVELISVRRHRGLLQRRRQRHRTPAGRGRYVPADVVVVGIGAEPNTEWLEGSGLELRAGVVCDAMGRTNIPGIVAVGDCAAWFDHARASTAGSSTGPAPWSARRWPSRRSWTLTPRRAAVQATLFLVRPARRQDPVRRPLRRL